MSDTAFGYLLLAIGIAFGLYHGLVQALLVAAPLLLLAGLVAAFSYQPDSGNHRRAQGRSDGDTGR